MKMKVNSYSSISSRISGNKKQFISGILFTFVLLFFGGCNFDFPEANQEPVFSIDTELHFDTGVQGGVLNLGLDGMGNEPYQIVVYPQWIDIKNFEGRLQNGYCSVPFDFKNVENFLFEGRAEGYVYIKLGSAGIFQVSVSYGISKIEQPPVEGEVPLYCSTAQIDFGTEETRHLAFTNKGEVDKTWYIDNIPGWLSISKTSGALMAGETDILTLTVNRDGLAPGDYSQIINLESTRPQLSHGILITMQVTETAPPVNSSVLKWFDGELKDAFFNKANNHLYLLTKSPNQLLILAPGTESLQTYPLDRIPNCMDLTADGKTIAIGYNQAYVDLINAETLERIQQYETDCVPFDLVFGENGWCYLAPETDQWVHFYSLNLETGVTYKSSSSVAIYEKSVLVKMPDKPLVYITRPQLSPTGLLIANIENGIANDTLPYWHETIGSRFWFSKDGSKILGGTKEIFQTPVYTTNSTHGEDLTKFGTIDIPGYNIQSLDYNETRQCFYAVGSDYMWTAENAETIYQVNAVSYSAVKSFKVNTYPGTLNNRSYPKMDVHFVFTNREGTELFAIKNVARDLEMNKWAVEIFSLSEE